MKQLIGSHHPVWELCQKASGHQPGDPQFSFPHTHDPSWPILHVSVTECRPNFTLLSHSEKHMQQKSQNALTTNPSAAFQLCQVSLSFLGIIRIHSSASSSLLGEELGHTYRSGYHQHCPSKGILSGKEEGWVFVSQDLVCRPLLFSCLESWDLRAKTLKH